MKQENCWKKQSTKHRWRARMRAKEGAMRKKKNNNKKIFKQ
jgi:hypothetical protein